MDRETYRDRKPELLRRDTELSEQLMADVVLHYTRQFSHVMGVRSDFVLWEREQMSSGDKARHTTYTLD